VTAARAGRPGIPAGPGVTRTNAPVLSAGRVMERGRSKALRPLPPEVRRAAVDRGLAAYGRGDWYLAHEELEPAWMGTDDPVERALLSGLIKLAAAYVHAARGNPLGVRTNLRGARDRLAAAAEAPVSAGPAAAAGATHATASIDLAALLAEVDDRLARVEALCASVPGAAIVGSTGPWPSGDPGTGGSSGDARAAGPPHDVAGPAGRSRGAPVAIALLPLPWRSA
jgi:hypothetical protein